MVRLRPGKCFRKNGKSWWEGLTMPRPKTHEERTVIINRIIELVKEQGRIMTKDVVAMFNLYRTTAEKYIWIVVQRGEHIRHGR